MNIMNIYIVILIEIDTTPGHFDAPEHNNAQNSYSNHLFAIDCRKKPLSKTASHPKDLIVKQEKNSLKKVPSKTSKHKQHATIARPIPAPTTNLHCASDKLHETFNKSNAEKCARRVQAFVTSPFVKYDE